MRLSKIAIGMVSMSGSSHGPPNRAPPGWVGALCHFVFITFSKCCFSWQMKPGRAKLLLRSGEKGLYVCLCLSRDQRP